MQFVDTMKICLVIVFTTTALFLVDAAPSQGKMRSKRSFHSYFENYFDEMATSACAAYGKPAGLYFAVRRECKLGPSCHQICTSRTIRKQAHIWKSKKLLNSKCVESFHIYKKRPSLADNKYADTDTNKVGLAIYQYNSCNTRGCGPNYCCCTGPHN